MTRLRLIREPSIGSATLGCLFLDGHFFCFTLEDVIRERPGEPVSAWKVPGETAIPAGRYRVIITPSPKFKRPLPLILDVPGFEGIRIHRGNRAVHSLGCPLVGRTRGHAFIGESALAEEALMARLRTAPGDIWIRIENPDL